MLSLSQTTTSYRILDSRPGWRLATPEPPSYSSTLSISEQCIPTNIGRILAHPATDAYCLDLLACHDSRIRHQPNSHRDEDDGRAQMARLTIMRGTSTPFY
ncbi:hypothetical protein BDV38DRAFT_3756 [Aspergillus pseudotamarii]|uniref:Uncharacterized protein n=1 Tax=Aspergillus pseudotamarii TaxID=132259 RepID=A0A5N6TC61_ASPPS|nr:uncharacterized protein BDV38DRAFT_3756 [Aspergillus pseudotamarii]KAE8143882.1 hypothetical protein BDV38DRAFT_3756 [Aspergillus pseudotamarii]